MSRPGTSPYVGTCRECGVVNGHSGNCRVDLIVESIMRGLKREGYVLVEASHHAELVEALTNLVNTIEAPRCRAIEILAKVGAQ
jgi:hypothetical protein